MLTKKLKEDWKDILSWDMEAMGWIFERAYSYSWNMSYFAEHFMNCFIREKMDNFDPYFQTCSSIDTLKGYAELFGEPPKSDAVYPQDSMMWIGQMYAYMVYFTDLSSKEIYKELPFSDMIEYYHLGHEMGFSVSAEKLCGLR